MKADLSRITFDPKDHFRRVLMQQGRVTLDADVNEQTSILLHYMRTLVRDLFGPYGGPADGGGFALSLDKSQKPYQLNVGAGHYYVDGILCECDGCDYTNQPDYRPRTPDAKGDGGDAFGAWLSKQGDGMFGVYLDVWERHITWIENDRIREVALGGPDTCTRSQVVWQVKAISVDTIDQPSCDALISLVPTSDAKMAVRLDPGLAIKDPCVLPPDSKYRGAENQLYRIEIHIGGNIEDKDQPTFKWSRDNGSIATQWLSTEGNDLIVGSSRGFTEEIWVELSDDWRDRNNNPGSLVKIAKVEGDRLSVDPVSITDPAATVWSSDLSNPKVRRWDQAGTDVTTLESGAVLITEGDWIDIEDGIQVQFTSGGTYRSGDYWVFPARVGAGIEWPLGTETPLPVPKSLPPMGIEHHYAPLGFVSNAEQPITDCRMCGSLTLDQCGPVGGDK